MKVLCVGSSVYDVTFPLENFIKENTKNRVNDCIKCGGGCIANAAYLLGKWGVDVSFAGIIGNDFYGKKIINEFKNVNVDTSYLQISDSFDTPISTIILNKNNGSRTIITNKSDHMKMKNIELNFTPDVILFDGEEYELMISLLKRYPNAIKIIDADKLTKELIELSKYADFMICSQNFAEKVTKMQINFENIKTIGAIYKKLKELFNNKIIVTLENNGALYEFNNKIRIMRPLTVETIDTTGAGDVFHGAFIYGILNRYDLESTIRISNIAASLSVTKLGGRTSIPTKESVKEILDEYK